MRTALVLGGALALFSAARPAAAQAPAPPPSSSGPGEEMAVAVPEAVIYSGPGDKCFRTGKLRQGERVLKLRVCPTDPGWLEIKPPFGSFSYINANFVGKTKDSRIGFVVAPPDSPVSVMPGSTFETTEPNVVIAKVERGTLLTLLPDGPVYAGSGAWLRIAPTPQEVRYIQAKDVAPITAVQRAVATGGPLGVNAPGAAPATVQRAAGPDSVDPMQRLYQQVLNDPNMDPATQKQALEHLQKLSSLVKAPRSTQGGIAPGQMPGNPNAVAAAPGAVSGQLVSKGGRPLPIAQNTTLYAGSPGAAPAPTSSGVRWSSWGTLRKTSLQKDGRQLYVLLDNQGKPVMYASPEPGKTLDPYVDKMVALYGAVAYRSDEFIRMDFMTVSYVAPTPGTASR